MRRGAIVALLGATLTASCTTQLVLDSEAEFAGIERQLEHNTRWERPLTLVVIHGMGPNSQGYSDYLTSELAARLGLDRTPITEDPDPKQYGECIKTNVHRCADGRKLVAKELYWRPLSSRLRMRRLAYDSSATETKNRLRYNAQIKRLLMNDRVADALIYLGPDGKSIRDAASAILGDELAESGEVAIVTHSLGSTIAFDTILRLARQNAIAPGVTIKLFMLANQLPMLELARARFAPDGWPTPTCKLEVIAIGDPNDILTYSFSDAFKRRHRRHACLEIGFTNVSVSIARQAYFGVFANPMSAHAGYYGDDRVIDLIARGWPAPALTARSRRRPGRP